MTGRPPASYRPPSTGQRPSMPGQARPLGAQTQPSQNQQLAPSSSQYQHPHHPAQRPPQMMARPQPSTHATAPLMQQYSSQQYPSQQHPSQHYQPQQPVPQQGGGYDYFAGYATSPPYQTSPSPPFSSPSAINNFIPMDPAYPLAAQMGLQLGTQALSAGQDFVNQRVNQWFSRETLRRYFEVDNTYVLAKLLLLLMPFRHKRQLHRNDVTGQIDGYKTPTQDINAPDLYIPTMAIVTYVLLVGLTYGLRREFKPELLGRMASRAMVFIVLELLVVRVGGYLLGVAADISLLDIMAMIGYNYVCLVVSLGANLAGGSWAKYGVFTYCSVAMAFFLLRSLRHLVLTFDNSSGPAVGGSSPTPPLSGVPEHRRRRINFLFTIVLAQLVASFFLLV